MPIRACDDRVTTVFPRFIPRFVPLAGAPGLSSAITNACRVMGDTRSLRMHSPASRGWEVMDRPHKARETAECARRGV